MPDLFKIPSTRNLQQQRVCHQKQSKLSITCTVNRKKVTQSSKDQAGRELEDLKVQMLTLKAN